MTPFLSIFLVVVLFGAFVNTQTKPYDADVIYRWNDLLISANSPLGFFHDFRDLAHIYTATWMTVACMAGRLTGQATIPNLDRSTRCNAAGKASQHYAASSAYNEIWKTLVQTRVDIFNASLLYWNSTQITGFVTAANAFHKQMRAVVKQQTGATDKQLNEGDVIGKAVAKFVWSIRKHDGFNIVSTWLPPCLQPPCPAGMWYPYSANHQPPQPQWVNLTLMCDDPILFAGKNDRKSVPVPPPPEVYGRVANESFNVVYNYGNLTSAIRTDEQLLTGRFWNEAGTFQYWNPVMKSINSVYLKLTLEQALRALFIVSSSVFDSNIMQYNYKLIYLQWRPWQRFNIGAFSEFALPPGAWRASSLIAGLPSPNHPDYPAGHPMSVGAWVHAFELVFPGMAGRDLPIAINYVTPSLAPEGDGQLFNLTYKNFMEFTDIVQARISIGYHTMHGGIEGHNAGRLTANGCFNKLSRFAGENPNYS